MRKQKVLIVEDRSYNHALFQKIFEDAGFEVAIKSKVGEFIVEEVLLLAPDIISMDIMIESTDPLLHDGIDVIERLQLDTRTVGIPIIVLTNFSDRENAERAKDVGAADFISLPGESLKNVPDYFTNFLRNPTHYKPSHPLFRK